MKIGGVEVRFGSVDWANLARNRNNWQAVNKTWGSINVVFL
jgi:hypothetical protein